MHTAPPQSTIPTNYHQTKHDFNLEKQTLIHGAKLTVQDELTKKEKDHEVQERIARSAGIGACCQKKMALRDDLLTPLMKEATSKCKVVADGSNYYALIQKLIVQGLIKIEEFEVVVYCRKEDVATMKKVIHAVVKKYVDIMEDESGIRLRQKVTVNPDHRKDLLETSNGDLVNRNESRKLSVVGIVDGGECVALLD